MLKPVSPDELLAELIKIKARMDRAFSAWSSREQLEDAEYTANLKRELALTKLAFGGAGTDNATAAQREELLARAGFSETTAQNGFFRVMVMQSAGGAHGYGKTRGRDNAEIFQVAKHGVPGRNGRNADLRRGRQTGQSFGRRTRNARTDAKIS
ncbi:MAG: hypothetical protein ACLUSP_00540 [Christensenellales bacterium]